MVKDIGSPQKNYRLRNVENCENVDNTGATPQIINSSNKYLQFNNNVFTAGDYNDGVQTLEMTSNIVITDEYQRTATDPFTKDVIPTDLCLEIHTTRQSVLVLKIAHLDPNLNKRVRVNVKTLKVIT